MKYTVRTRGDPDALIVRTYACNTGGTAEDHTFEVRERRDERPKFCPVCGNKIGSVAKPRPARIALGGSAIARSVDQTYRAIEASSAERAALAGSNALKITDMKDHLREGDVAVKMPVNSVTNFMDFAKDRGVQYGWGGGMSSGVAFNGPANPVPQNTWTGPGHVALSGIQGVNGSTAAEIRAQMTAAGQINRGKE